MAGGLAVAAGLALAVAVIPSVARRRGDRRGHRLDRGSRRRDLQRDVRVRDLRAERRARELLRSIAGERAYESYARFGVVALERERGGYGYLIYPHRPVVSYDARTGELLSEYCVRFPDGSSAAEGEWLPDADDLLAKWMALHGDERRLIDEANMHLPGRQHDPAMVRRDLETLRGESLIAFAGDRDGKSLRAPLGRRGEDHR